MKSKYVASFFAAFLIGNAATVFAQLPPEKSIKIVVTPNHENWLYNMGEKATFSIAIYKKGTLVENTKVGYEVGHEKMTPTKKDSLALAKGKAEIEGGTLKEPGFLRCIVTAKVEGVVYKGMATAGFNPEKLEPTVTQPADFDQFWDKAKDELAKIPIDPKMLLLAEKSTGSVNVYELSLGNIDKSRFYGILCVPKKEGKYPAIFLPPGAGVKPIYADMSLAAKEVITLTVGVNGIPVTMDEGVYKDLSVGALKQYPNIGLEDKNRYYYKRVFLGCLRSIDFLTSMPEFDGQNLGVMGGSQGGALSIVTTALDSRVKFLAVHFPAMCDMTGFLHKRAGGWPLYFTGYNPQVQVKEKQETISYYDVVNFAKRIKVEGIYTWGYNDEICSPTSIYCAYNNITAPKNLVLSLETGHYILPETNAKLTAWLIGKLKK